MTKRNKLTLGSTRKVIPHCGTGGGRWMETLPGVFDMLQYFETILPLEAVKWKAFDLLNKMRYLSWVVALLEACDVTNNGRHLGRHPGHHLGFYQELEIRL